MEYKFVNNMNKPYKKNSEVGFDVTNPISNPEFYLRDLNEYVAKDVFNKIKFKVLRNNGYIKVLSIESVIKRADEMKFSRFTEKSLRPFYSDLITFLTEYFEDVYKNEDTSRPNLVDSNGIKLLDNSDSFDKEKLSLYDKSLTTNENKIHSLTNEKLAEFGFSQQVIEGILTSEYYESRYLGDNGEYFISKSEKRIYTQEEYYLKSGVPMFFPYYDYKLIREYYEQKLKVYLKNEANEFGPLFIRKNSIIRFKENEIKLKKDEIKDCEKYSQLPVFSKKIKVYERYVDWLGQLKDDSSLMDLETNNKKLVIIDKVKALEFIDEFIMDTFLEAEKKALAPNEKFSSDVRCAAFCELLYERKHIKQTKTNQITMNEFAKLRYGLDIKLALATSKSEDRKSHQKRKVMNMTPLNKCF
jgi:hypothetical protein